MYNLLPMTCSAYLTLPVCVLRLFAIGQPFAMFFSGVDYFSCFQEFLQLPVDHCVELSPQELFLSTLACLLMSSLFILWLCRRVGETLWV